MISQSGGIVVRKMGLRMRWMMVNCRIFMLVALLPILVACKDNLLGNDIRLFNEVSALAKAVAAEDINKIEKILSREPTLLNYQEPRFGQTLLMWSILNDRYTSTEMLLRLGADPNLQNHDGLSSLMYAAEWRIEEWKGDPKYLKLLLKYGGDPNSIAKPTEPPARFATPLIAAVNSFSLENVKILVDAGANPDYNDRCTSALTAAFHLSQIEMVRYFIIDKKVDIHNTDCKTLGGDDITVLTRLRKMTYPLNSHKHKVKMEVVEYVKLQGFDYYKEPVPKHFYKIYDAEFLEKY